jgi:DNA-directed RNA polymerase specialized sigma24 family protein
MTELTFDPGTELLTRALCFEPALRSQLKRAVGSASEYVEELLQQTYARILVSGEDPAIPTTRLKTFVFQILQQVLKDHAATPEQMPQRVSDGSDIDGPTSLKAGQPLEGSAPADGGREPVTQTPAEIEEAELFSLIACVQVLPNLTRRAFSLRKVYGHSFPEIATRLGIPESEVAKHLEVAARACASALFDPPLGNRKPGRWRGVRKGFR